MSDLPILDREILSLNTGGDVRLAIEVLGIFQEQAQMWSRLLDPKAEADRWCDGVHTVKGSAGSVGARRLEELCGLAEETGRERELSLAETAVLLDDVRNEIGAAVEAAAACAHDLSLSGFSKAS